MRDALPPSSEQVLVFLAVVDHGSFSAAARSLRRAQSAVTYAIQQLESDLGVSLFDRGGGRPVLTPQGAALLRHARRIAHEIAAMQRRAHSLVQGEEPELRLVVESMFPMPQLVGVIKGFAEAFPSVTLRLFVETLGAAAERVIDRTCTIGIAGPVGVGIDDLTSIPMGTIARVPVAAPDHPLARWKEDIPADVLADHVQLVTTDRSALSRDQEFGVLSPVTWRLTDLGAKHAMILAGLGWGSLPRHMVETDLLEKRLVELHPAGSGSSHWLSSLPLFAIHRADAELGPAARDMLTRLRTTLVGA